MKLYRFMVMVLIAVCLAGVVYAGGSGESSTGDSSSGTITVYTALEDEQVSEYLNVFNKRYPKIKVNIIRESTGIITAKLLAEKSNPQADLVWGTAASSMMVMDDLGMLEPYSPKGIERILPKFKSSKAFLHGLALTHGKPLLL